MTQKYRKMMLECVRFLIIQKRTNHYFVFLLKKETQNNDGHSKRTLLYDRSVVMVEYSTFISLDSALFSLSLLRDFVIIVYRL